jgi:hypothetical protein
LGFLIAMRRSLAPILTAMLCVLAACGGEDETPAPPVAPSAEADQTVAFPLGAENRSGASGTARLKGGGGGFTVILALKGPKHSSPAHIHNVTCEKYRAMKDFDAQFATVEANLSDVVDGKSKTRVETDMSKYRTAGFSINVHSYEGEFPVVSCGDIPAA